MRATLKSLFKRRDCVTLVRPVEDERALQTLPELSYAELRPQFRTEMEALRAKVLGLAGPKQVHGVNINGAGLVRLAESYTEAINDGAVPTICSAWEAVC
jgi:hypothetical protein